MVFGVTSRSFELGSDGQRQRRVIWVALSVPSIMLAGWVEPNEMNPESEIQGVVIQKARHWEGKKARRR